MLDLGKLNITVTKTADGAHDYVQILSADQFSLNVVLIGEITVKDTREAPMKLPAVMEGLTAFIERAQAAMVPTAELQKANKLITDWYVAAHRACEKQDVPSRFDK